MFDKTFVDMGTVPKGESRKEIFRFKNIGQVPLAIDIVSACDCTTLDYPLEEIAPGQTGTIVAEFDSSKEEGEKIVDITIVFKNQDPKTGYPWVEEVKYKAFVK